MAAAHKLLNPKQFDQLYAEGSKPHYEYWFGKALQKSMPTAMHLALAFVIPKNWLPTP